MLYTPRLIPTADSSMSSVVRSRLTPMTGIYFSKEVETAPLSGNFASWCQTTPLSAILWKLKLRHYQKSTMPLSMRGATGQLRSHLQPEARQLALLQVVVNKEANPDGQRNKSRRRHCQHLADL
jgi:hypothetical protein